MEKAGIEKLRERAARIREVAGFLSSNEDRKTVIAYAQELERSASVLEKAMPSRLERPNPEDR